jgi:glycosyltransferase involved in cell wall biosynthesis
MKVETVDRARPLIVHATEAMGGGVQSAIAAYTNLLSDCDHIVLGRPRSSESTYGFGPNVTVRAREGGLAEFLRWLRSTIKEVNPDVVHIHSSLAGALRLMPVRGVRVVYSPHCFSFERRDVGRVKREAYKLAEALFARRTDAFVAVSPHERDLCESLNSRAEAIYVPNIVKPGPAVRLRRVHRVVMTGRIGPQKDPSFFAAVARQSVTPIEFMWVGDGEESDRGRLLECGVTITGWLSPSRVLEIVRDSALYLHTGAWEASPIASMEAAVSGTPVLTRDIPTMRSLGYAVAGSTPAVAASAVDRFFDDDAFAGNVRALTRQVASAFSEDQARQRLLLAYNVHVRHKEQLT